MICLYTFHQRKKKRKRKKETNKQTNKMACAPKEDSDQPGHPPSLIRVWSEFSLSAWRKFGSLPTYWAHIEDYDQTGRMPRLICVFAGCKDHFVGLVMRRLIYFRRTFAFKLKCSCWKKKKKKKKCRCVDIFCEIVPKYLNVIIQIYQFCRSYN